MRIMICAHCRLERYGGVHMPGWCFDYIGPEPAPVVLPAKPKPIRGQLGVCAIAGCYYPTVPGMFRCSPCSRAIRS